MLMKEKVHVETRDDSISQFPQATQDLHSNPKKCAQDAVEVISYQMSTFLLKGNVVHFAACKNHLGFYPGPSGMAAFQEELSIYKTAKGSVQFPINQNFPHGLIENILCFCACENLKQK